MVFYPPAWVPKLPTLPDDVSVEQFITDERYGRHPLARSRNPFTCGITNKTHDWPAFLRRTDNLARAIAHRFAWSPEEGTPWDKVGAIFSLNSIDYLSILFAIHRSNGIATPVNAAYSAAEVAHQLSAARARALFTCVPLLTTAREAARTTGIPDDRIFLVDLPLSSGADRDATGVFKTVDDLITEGASLPPLPPLEWIAGQGARQPAYLCFSSGTSGLPKAVVISHLNVIANCQQLTIYESVSHRHAGVGTQNESGLLPFSHIYGLVVIAQAGIFRGDGIIVLPRFEFEPLLNSIEKYRIQQLHIVPPILVRMLHEKETCAKYDLSSVRFTFTGAAPAGEETLSDLKKLFPTWAIGQGYGMTETCTVVCSTSELDIMPRSSGSLLPGTIVKIIDPNGHEITAYDTPGELLVQGPSVTLGYLNNEAATAETFVHHADGRWCRTGDEVLVTRNPASGNEHLVVVDRIKELIKVKGHQVAPAELEAHLLTHPAVADVAVIQVPDERAGEVPKAFVVKATSETAAGTDADLATAIAKHVQEHKASYKWLKGGVEFIDAIPKSPSGKILRRLLRDQEKARRTKAGAKL